MPNRQTVFEFKADLRKFSQKIQEDILDTQKLVLFELFRRIVMRTPIDTGRAAGSWNISFNQPEVAEEGYGPEASMARITQIDFGRFGKWWIYNNLPYIRRLEYGWSKQAPVGMVRVSIAEVEAQIDAIIKGRKRWAA